VIVEVMCDVESLWNPFGESEIIEIVMELLCDQIVMALLVGVCLLDKAKHNVKHNMTLNRH